MPRQSCTVCRHVDRQNIETAIAKGFPSLRELAKQSGLSLTALFRHKQHMTIAKGTAMNNIPEEIRKLRIMLAKAKRKGDTSSALSISREIRAWLALEAKTTAISNDAGAVEELRLSDALVLAKNLIESQMENPDVREWLRSMAEQVCGTTGKLPDAHSETTEG